jgi:N-acetylneuraminic acid mutarotase
VVATLLAVGMLVQIPIELQNYIISCLDTPYDLAQVALLSKHFHKLSLTPDTWEKFVQRKWNVSKFFNVPYKFDWKLYFREKESIAQPLTWSPVVNITHPSPRQCHGAVALGSNMVIFGGHQIEGDNFNRHDDMWFFDSQNSSFTEIQTQGIRIPPISRHRMVAINNRIYSFGGILHNRQKLNSVFMFNPETLCWSELVVNNEPPSPRCDPAVVAYKHSIVVYGGSIKDLAFPSDVHVFDTQTLTWSHPTVSGTIPPSRIGSTAVVVRDQMYIYGGGEYNREERKYTKLYHEMWTLDLKTWEWTHLEVKGTIPKISDFLNAFVVGNHIVIGGGWNTNPYAFDTVTRTWMELPSGDSVIVNNNDASAVHIGNHVYYYGGYHNEYKHHLHALDIGHLDFLMKVE